MTTATTSAPVDHTSDAGFRAWIIDLHSLFTSAGLVQTADTGQINTATATRPGVNTDAGYAIWRLPSSTLFFKLVYGTGSVATAPSIKMTVGTGSDGAGALTGQTSTETRIGGANTTPNSTVSNRTSYCCVTNGFFGFLWKADGRATTRVRSMGGFACEVVAGLGYAVMVRATSSSVTAPYLQSVRTVATAEAYEQSIAFVVIPGFTGTAPANSLDANGDTQVYANWGMFPTVKQLLYICTVRTADVTELNTFSVALDGVTSHTYLSLGLQYLRPDSAYTATGAESTFSYDVAMLWE